MTGDYGELLVNLIKEGETGNNEGLSTSIPKLPKVLRKQIGTVLGGTGSGKTYVVMNEYGLFIVRQWIKRFSKDPNKIFHWMIFSFEMEKDELILRLASYIYAMLTNKLIPSQVIAGFETGLLKEDKEWIIENCAPMLTELSPYFTIYPAKTNQEIETIIHKYYAKHGKFDDEGNYVTDKHITLLCTVDHLGLLSGQGTTKQLIDELGRFQVRTNTIYKTSWINAQQFNREEGGVQITKNTDDIRPSLREAKDSSTPIDNAHWVVGMFNPNRFELAQYLGYPIKDMEVRQSGEYVQIKGLEDRVRVWFILKRRFGVTGYISTAFYGEAGVFQELPLPDKLTNSTTEKIVKGTWFPKQKQIKSNRPS